MAQVVTTGDVIQVPDMEVVVLRWVQTLLEVPAAADIPNAEPMVVTPEVPAEPEHTAAAAAAVDSLPVVVLLLLVQARLRLEHLDKVATHSSLQVAQAMAAVVVEVDITEAAVLQEITAVRVAAVVVPHGQEHLLHPYSSLV